MNYKQLRDKVSVLWFIVAIPMILLGLFQVVTFKQVDFVFAIVAAIYTFAYTIYYIFKAQESEELIVVLNIIWWTAFAALFYWESH